MRETALHAIFAAALLLLVTNGTKAEEKSCDLQGEALTSDAKLVPGEILLVVRNEEILCANETGMASLELPTALTRHSAMRIASLTKQFTAVGILTLVEAGQLSLDDVLGELLCEIPPHWRVITIRQLLSHTSGLTGDLTRVLPHIAEDLAPRQLVGLFHGAPPIAQPGQAWQYSNLNYWILGLVIEAVTAKPYSAYINEAVLKPAGLSHARYGENRTIINGRARGYEIGDQGGITNARYFSSSIGYSAGGYVASALDIARWYGALGEGKIISPKLLTLALTPVKINDGSRTGYGLGWYLSEIDDHQIAHHGGSSIGFMSYIYWSPEHSLFAGVFRNWSDAGGEPVSAARSLLISEWPQD